MKNIVYFLLTLTVIFTYFAHVWKKKVEYDYLSEGVTDSTIQNFLLNSFNGMMLSTIPEKFNQPILDWQEIIPEAHILKDHFDIIKAEAHNLLKDYHHIPRFNDVDGIQAPLINYDNRAWKTFFFKFYGEFNKTNCEKCPKTAELLRRLPIDLAMFSILEEDKNIPPHRGPWKGLLRLHLAIDIPSEAVITIDNKDYQWKEGELFLFDDTYIHSVKNPKAKKIVLFMDIKRDHIPSIFHTILDILGNDYFHKVNKGIEKRAQNRLNFIETQQ
jgi:beta-hydroxylase